MYELICFGWQFGGKTVLKNIYAVEPNTIIKMNEEKIDIFKCPKVKEYQLGDLYEYIYDAVKKCSFTSRKLALALSGGADSTIIAAMLNQLAIKDIDTFSIRIEGSNDHINSLEELNLTNGDAWKSWKHHVIDITSGDFKNYFNESIRIYGQPTYMSSVPLVYALAKSVAELGNTVLLTGEGSDELFLGYQSYIDIVSPDKYLDVLQNEERKSIIKSVIGSSSYELTIKNFYKNFPDSYDDIADYIRSCEKRLSLQPLLQRQNHLLTHFGIEGRTPYLHSHISDYAEKLKYKEMINETETKVPIYKILKCMGIDIRRTVKIPFRSPIQNWFNGPLKSWTKNNISAFFPYYKLLDFNLEAINIYINKENEWTIEETRILYFLLSVGSFISQINKYY